ncbi:substrate-binding periplasmic protein [Chitinimonas koreensis]|uniref:substrate-binding periplasmic protein n=1 Tax=Chitinimonas koreensis TaxID=356302 RepID=UPI0003FD7B4D|nr:transporter substrate-binding domain-containing protein [Chitinimonas koreensis]QNM95175.1 ABC transporter substrate-binding protein [Chitinimonas koreensis]
MRWIAWLALGLFGCAMADEVVLRSSGQDSVAPKYIYRGETPTGLCPDILAAIERQDGALRFSGLARRLSVPQVERRLEAGQLDVFCALVHLPRREKTLRFVETPLYPIRHRVAVVAGDNAAVADLDALARLSRADPVIVTSGLSFVELLSRHGVRLDDGASDNAINLRKLLGGRGRFFYHNELLLLQLIREQGATDRVKLLPTVFAVEPQHLVVGRHVPQAVFDRLDAAVRALQERGELERLYRLYAH